MAELRGETLLDISGLRKSYGERHVADGVDLCLHRGEIIGLMGGSGSGKSTILKLIIGLEKPDSGKVWFAGEELTCLSERQLLPVRSGIGFVFQNGALFDSLSVEENVSYPLHRHTMMSEKEIREKVNERLKLVGMENTNSLYPAQLSGGMQKRAGLIRATILDPQLVLFDEPTAALDTANVRNFVDQVHRIRKRQGLSGILVSHDVPSIIAICDRIAILHEGKIHAFDEVAAIRASRDPVVRSLMDIDYDGSEGVQHEQAS
jgi:phospholipid/cholesterol/gamma-HCH transport system ATP-binding protein